LRDADISDFLDLSESVDEAMDALDKPNDDFFR
jgi:hypothetical protein